MRGGPGYQDRDSDLSAGTCIRSQSKPLSASVLKLGFNTARAFLSKFW